jgi:putative inorganic carbon (HCO3(-)) transporter
MGFLKSTAFYFAIATVAVFIPTQLSAEGRISIFSTEVKAILVLTLLALFSVVIAKDRFIAWEEFNATFIKAVIMFVVMVNVVRTRQRLMTMLWLSLGIGLILGYTAMGMYWRGEVSAEGYRVAVEIGGIFANPNDLALHLVTMIPIALCLGLASKSNLVRLIYLTGTVFMIAGCMVTYSRGGFLGLVAAMGVLVWKFGRKNRLKVSIVSLFVGGLVILFAPGNYGMRILSIVGLAPDAVGSSDQRTELLKRSILVSIRNPWGIGIGNFPIVGIRNLVSHNAYTQVSAEIGIFGLIAYLIFMISPFRKLGAIERILFDKNEVHGWFYYLAVGLQASIIGYMVSSFFVSVAYNWFIYYLIAYAVAFRRIYQIEKGSEEDETAYSLRESILNWRAKSV